MGNERYGVPLCYAVVNGARTGGGDSDEGDEGEERGQQRYVNELPLDGDTAISTEIGLVDGEGCLHIAVSLLRNLKQRTLAHLLRVAWNS